MKEPKTPPPPPVILTYVYPPPASPAAANEGPGQDAAKAAGEIVVLVNTNGQPQSVVIQHNFNLSTADLDRKLPDVAFEAEDPDFYAQKPTIVKRAPNSVTIDLNPGEAIFGHKPTIFAVKLKRYYTPAPVPAP